MTLVIAVNDSSREEIFPELTRDVIDRMSGQLLAAMGRRHPFRPAHIHFMISAPRYRTLVTHLFLDGDKYLGSDAVFGVKPSLIIRPRRMDGINTVEYDFGLADEQDSTRAQVEEFSRQRRQRR